MARHQYSDYKDAYPYDLSDHDDLTDFNIERQASIIEDYWRLSISPPMTPLNNTGTNKGLSYYEPFAAQVRSAGPPRKPAIPSIPGHWH